MHLWTRAGKSPRGTRNWTGEMTVNGKGRSRRKWKDVSLVLLSQINAENCSFCNRYNHFPIFLCIIFSSIRITPIIWNYPICLHRTLAVCSHGLCAKKTEQLPTKVLMKSSESEPNCFTWCDTIATQSPHHYFTAEVFRRASESTAHICGTSNFWDVGKQTNVNNIARTMWQHGGDILKRPVVQRWELKERNWIGWP